jgi:hypothetical protein
MTCMQAHSYEWDDTKAACKASMDAGFQDASDDECYRRF